MQVRQGDVMVAKVAQLPKDLKAVAPVGGRVVLACGEVTGHAHVLDAALAELFEDHDGVLYLKVTASGAAITHEEHGAIPLALGTYRVTRQREYSPEAIRKVSD